MRRTTQDVLDIELGPNQGVLSVINETGDTKVIWDRTVPAEVEAAKVMFDSLKAKGHMGYKVEGKDGKKGEVLHKFDPEAERVIMSPPLKGGRG